MDVHLYEGVELLAQKQLVFSRGHAFEQLEEQLLLLHGGRWKHGVCLSVMSRFWPAGIVGGCGVRYKSKPRNIQTH